MVIGIRLVVVIEEWGYPQGGAPEVFDVRHFVNNSLEVSAMAGSQIAAVHGFDIPFYFVVLVVAVGEAVGHQKVNGILGSETFTHGRALFPCFQFKFARGDLFAVPFEVYLEFAGFRVFVYVQVDEQVIGIACLHLFGDAYPVIIYFRDGFGDVLTVAHQLHGRIVHSNPPI